MLLLFAHDRDEEGRPKLPDPFAGQTPSPRELFETFLFLNGLHRLPAETKAGMWRAEVEKRREAVEGKRRGRPDRARHQRPDGRAGTPAAGGQ